MPQASPYEDIFLSRLPSRLAAGEIDETTEHVIGHSAWMDVMRVREYTAEQVERAAFNNYEVLKEIFGESSPQATREASRLASLYLSHFRFSLSAIPYIDSVNASLGEAIDKRERLLSGSGDALVGK